MGFLFAIPRRIVENRTSVNNNTYFGNDNLVQISDWITKIFLSLGIVNLKELPTILKRTAEHIGFKNPNGIGLNTTVVESLILFFSISGFLLAYLYTRLYFHKLLNDGATDKNQNNG